MCILINALRTAHSIISIKSNQMKINLGDCLLGVAGEFGSSSPEWGGDIGTFPGSMEVNAHASMGIRWHGRHSNKNNVAGRLSVFMQLHFQSKTAGGFGC
jgi:hypothetical protein